MEVCELLLGTVSYICKGLSSNVGACWRGCSLVPVGSIVSEIGCPSLPFLFSSGIGDGGARMSETIVTESGFLGGI